MHRIKASLLALFISVTTCAQRAPSLNKIVPLWEAGCVLDSFTFVPLMDTTASRKPAAAAAFRLAVSGKARLKATEMSSSPHNSTVSLIQLRNSGREAYWLPAGTLLKGGWQNRMITQTTLIPPGDTPVYAAALCIEKNRWEGRKSGFDSWRMPDARLSAQLAVNPHQQAIWKCVDAALDSAKTQSATADYLAIRSIGDTAGNTRLQACLAQDKMSNAAGVLILSKGRLLMAEVFARPQMMMDLLSGRLPFYRQLPAPSGTSQVKDWQGNQPVRRYGEATAHAMYWY